MSAGDGRYSTPRERKLAGSVRPPPAGRVARGHAPADEFRGYHGYVAKVTKICLPGVIYLLLCLALLYVML